MKTCNKCGETKKLDDFHRSKQTPSGRVAWCKLCKQKYHAERMAQRGQTVTRGGHNIEWPQLPHQCVYRLCENDEHPDSPIGHCETHMHLYAVANDSKPGRCIVCQKPTPHDLCRRCKFMESSDNPNTKTYK